jgi:hypothetical protein
VAGVGFVLLAVLTAGGSYWSTLFPGILVLGVGMGITVAPLTATVMTSVSQDHAGVASGINNAVSRAAGLLAIAALGIVVVARFDASFGRELDALDLPANTRAAMEQQRGKLAGAEPPKDVDARTRDAIRRAVDGAFVDGFRVLMFTCAGLAVLSAGAARILVPRRGT